MIVRTEGRCRIGITWYDSEAEAVVAAAEMLRARPNAVRDANIGFVQCGRAPQFDQPGEYAVVTP